MVFSKNWIPKNWKSIGIHCWTSINEFIDGPSMNSLRDAINEFIDGPSMNMVPFLWALLWAPWDRLWAPWGPGNSLAPVSDRGERKEHTRFFIVFAWIFMVFHCSPPFRLGLLDFSSSPLLLLLLLPPPQHQIKRTDTDPTYPRHLEPQVGSASWRAVFKQLFRTVVNT